MMVQGPVERVKGGGGRAAGAEVLAVWSFSSRSLTYLFLLLLLLYIRPVPEMYVLVFCACSSADMLRLRPDRLHDQLRSKHRLGHHVRQPGMRCGLCGHTYGHSGLQYCGAVRRLTHGLPR